MHKAILWDMDGTLVDSEEEHYITWRDVLAPLGVDLTREQFKHMLGMRNDLIADRLFGGSLSEAEVTRIGLEKEAAYRRLVRENGVTVLPGAGEMLRRLHEDGWRQFVASSAPLKNIETVVEACGFDGYVEGLISADEVRRGKPYPDLYLEAAARFAVPASSCIVVEDAHVGVEAARKAGMRTIAVRTTHSDVEGDLTIDRLDELTVADFYGLLRGDLIEQQPRA